MCVLRLVAVWLLIAALPVYGWASLGVSGSCSMERAAMNSMPDGSDVSDPCCTQTTPDEESGANPADLCKTGQTCQSGALSALPAADAPQFADFGQVTGRFGSALHAGDSPPAVWRPPRAL